MYCVTAYFDGKPFGRTMHTNAERATMRAEERTAWFRAAALNVPCFVRRWAFTILDERDGRLLLDTRGERGPCPR